MTIDRMLKMENSLQLAGLANQQEYLVWKPADLTYLQRLLQNHQSSAGLSPAAPQNS